MDSLSSNLDSLSPNLFVRDIRSTIEFYKILGFHLIMSVPGEGKGEDEGKGELVWAMVTSGKVSFMFQTFHSLGDTLPQISRQDGGSLLFYIKIQQIRAFFEQAKRMLHRRLGIQIRTAIAERVRRDIHDAHHQCAPSELKRTRPQLPFRDRAVYSIYLRHCIRP